MYCYSCSVMERKIEKIHDPCLLGQQIFGSTHRPLLPKLCSQSLVDQLKYPTPIVAEAVLDVTRKVV